MENSKKCQHGFQYKAEVVKLHHTNGGWFDAKRVIIFCTNCGEVSHDQTNSSSPYGQDLSPTTKDKDV